MGVFPQIDPWLSWIYSGETQIIDKGLNLVPTGFPHKHTTYICKGMKSPLWGGYSPTAIFNIPDQGCNSACILEGDVGRDLLKLIHIPLLPPLNEKFPYTGVVNQIYYTTHSCDRYQFLYLNTKDRGSSSNVHDGTRKKLC